VGDFPGEGFFDSLVGLLNESKMKDQSQKFTISLRENGIHSFSRGIELSGNFKEHQDNLILKDAVMFLHHGIELLMKEMLSKHSPFLIFEDLHDAATKQKKADTDGVGIFYLAKPPKTVTYDEAIRRVSAFIKPKELTDKLLINLDKLNQFRNQLEHYAIEADREEVVQLLVALREPLLELFESQLGNIRYQQPAKVEEAWASLEESAKFYNHLEQDVIETVRLFNGQEVPGYLFNIDDKIILPKFSSILPNQRILADGKFYEPDILGEGSGFRWIIEVKGALRDSLGGIAQVSSLSHSLNAQQSWLVAFSDVNDTARALAHTYGVLVTGAKEWKKLKHLVLSQKAG
jgi:hypothetical protein